MNGFVTLSSPACIITGGASPFCTSTQLDVLFSLRQPLVMLGIRFSVAHLLPWSMSQPSAVPLPMKSHRMLSERSNDFSWLEVDTCATVQTGSQLFCLRSYLTTWPDWPTYMVDVPFITIFSATPSTLSRRCFCGAPGRQSTTILLPCKSTNGRQTLLASQPKLMSAMLPSKSQVTREKRKSSSSGVASLPPSPKPLTTCSMLSSPSSIPSSHLPPDSFGSFGACCFRALLAA
mmetsp:Transcript_113523/g.299827  ORF Transcript_113523/g.299827 Transcript_113523/m.299827 type:complete len:233 (-) Transcript_113523:60-758(-)